MTTDNTPLNADDELRDELDKYLFRTWNIKDTVHNIAMVDGIEKLVQADRKKHELQAYSDGFQKASKGAFKSQQAAKREAVEAVLDMLLDHGEDFTTFGDGCRSVAVEHIEAERNNSDGDVR